MKIEFILPFSFSESMLGNISVQVVEDGMSRLFNQKMNGEEEL